jgi:hypothetical protein
VGPGSHLGAQAKPKTAGRPAPAAWSTGSPPPLPPS